MLYTLVLVATWGCKFTHILRKKAIKWNASYIIINNNTSNTLIIWGIWIVIISGPPQWVLWLRMYILKTSIGVYKLNAKISQKQQMNNWITKTSVHPLVQIFTYTYHTTIQTSFRISIANSSGSLDNNRL